jgi:hypothetical protein
MSNSEHALILKLDEFIRRYYKNQLIKGSLYSAGILLSAFLTVTLLEYYGQFNQVIRGILFFAFISAALAVLGRYIVIPLLKLYRIGSIISYDQAAGIIGTHFNNVQDKLLNVLQLRSHRAMYVSDELLLAGIDQKIEELSPVPFSAAIDLNQNRRYLRYVLPLMLVTLLLAIVWPHVFSRSTERLVNFDTYYEKEMPFQFDISNKSLKALQSKDFKLQVEVKGNQVPSEVFIEVNNIEYRLEKNNKILFSHLFTNLQSDVTFRLYAAGFYSREYTLKVLPKPSLQHFNVQLVYPSYLKRNPEQLVNTGDLQVPAGTRVTWMFNTKNTEQLEVRFTDTLVKPVQQGENQFTFGRRFFRDNRYVLRPTNSFVSEGADSVSYGISVTPDHAPTIDLTEKTDSVQPGYIYFSGQIRDDYGFTSLTFHYKKTGTDSSGRTSETSGKQVISIDAHKVAQPYFHFFDATQYQLQAGDKVEYYFEVFDNDGVNGPKSSRTQLLIFKAPTRDEISEALDKSNSEIKKDLEESIKKAAQLQKDINELSKKINDKQQLGYEDKKSLQELMKKQQDLQQKIDDLKQQNEQKNKQQNEFSPMDESILEKQKQLEQLFDNVMTPEMKKLFDELNKMLEKLDKNQVQEKLEELKFTNKDIEKELDRNLEAFRQLEMQQKMLDAIQKLEEIQKKQEELKDQTEGKSPKEETPDKQQDAKKNEDNSADKEKSKENKDDSQKKSEEQKSDKKTDKKETPAELEKKQEELKKEFEQLRKDLEEAKEKNKALEEPMNIPETGKTEEEISQEMEKSAGKLNQGNKKSAAQNQKNAAEKMEKMKQEMEQAMEESEEQQDEENAQALRQILENLLNLSFSQEDLIKELRNVRVDNPRYVDIPKAQNKLKDNSKIIEDSLLALSKRAPQISAIVNREISAINMNMDKTIRNLADRNTGESSMRMQSTMKSVNDLAVMLNESLEQMQKQMQQKKSAKAQKSGKCKKPGTGDGQSPANKGKPAANMRQMQEQLNRQLKELKEALEKGEKPGPKPGEKDGKKPGNMGPGGTGLPSMRGGSEQFAKMAAQQEALRRQMEQLMQNMKNKGREPGGSQTAELMEQTERDLVNKRITNETMRRQQEILTRLLESEKAEREREQDQQRKSNEAKSEFQSNPEQFLEYKRLKEKEMELLITVPPSLTPYYREKVNNYFNQLNK